MRNTPFIIALSVLVSTLCLIYLFFTVVSRNIQHTAEQYAQQPDDKLDFAKKQHTPQEVEYELIPGLDLRGSRYMMQEVAVPIIQQACWTSGRMLIYSPLSSAIPHKR